MGTRGITKVINNGETVVAQYGQWDHYPSGQGITALQFVSNPDNVAKLKAGLANVYDISEEDHKALIRKYTDNENGWFSGDQATAYSNDNPSLTRDTGAGILEVIANSTGPVPIIRDLEFENDELFCEGSYTVNLDNNTFISKYGEATVVCNLSALPTIEQYLDSFETVNA